MKKLLVIMCFALCSCQNSSAAQEPPAPQNIVLLDRVGISNATDLYVVLDKKRGVTCWVTAGYHVYAGSGIWCMKNDIPIKE